MTRFWWVRHGPTHEKAFCGWRDVPADLSDKAALLRLNAYLPTDAVLVSSDLSRAIATADALAAGRQRLAHLPDLRELHFGEWDGLTFSAVSEKWPDLSREYWEEPGHAAPPKGESWRAAEARIHPAVDSLLARHGGRDIVAVAHFGTILMQLQRALAISPYKALSYRIDNLSVTRLTHDGTRWRAGEINHIP